MTQRHEVCDGFESGCTYQIQKLVISYSQLLAKQSLHQHAKKTNIEDYSGECRQDSGSKLGPLHPEGLSSANSATCARCLLQITEIWILRWFVPLSLFNFTAVQMKKMEQTRSNRVFHKIRYIDMTSWDKHSWCQIGKRHGMSVNLLFQDPDLPFSTISTNIFAERRESLQHCVTVRMSYGNYFCTRICYEFPTSKYRGH